MSWVAYTPREGHWRFTRSETQIEAQEVLLEAIRFRRVLCIPIDNPISAVPAGDVPGQHEEATNDA